MLSAQTLHCSQLSSTVTGPDGYFVVNQPGFNVKGGAVAVCKKQTNKQETPGYRLYGSVEGLTDAVVSGSSRWIEKLLTLFVP